MVINPDPNGTGIVYSQFADNPNTDAALTNLAQNLGNDPIRIYEWVRNNVRTEFYVGCNRGASLTMLELAGNDIDQAALLGALFRAAGYTPTYYLESMAIPRTASGANRLGGYEFLGVTDDVGATSMLAMVGASFGTGGDNNMYFTYMRVEITIPGRGLVRFVPALKPHNVGRRPDVDSITGYNLTNARAAAGAYTAGNYSPAINVASFRSYLTSLATQASDTIRTSATLHDMDGGELARRPVIVPELVTLTAPNASSYPEVSGYDTGPTALALSGIPVTYVGHFKVSLGTHTRWFEVPELLGRSITCDFAANGTGYLRLNGAEIASEGSGGPSSNVQVGIAFEMPVAYYGGSSQQYSYTSSILRQRAFAIPYRVGRSVYRVQKGMAEVARKESASPGSITLADRLQIIGDQYFSQAFELRGIGSNALDHELGNHFSAAICYTTPNSVPQISVGVSLRFWLSRSGSAPLSSAVRSATDMVGGGLEGTAIEQMSGNRSFGAPGLLDYAMTQSRGFHLVTSQAQYNQLVGNGSLQNTHLLNATEIQARFSAGYHLVLLSNTAVPYGGYTFHGYYVTYPGFGGAGTMINGDFGGVSTGTIGNLSFAPIVFSLPNMATLKAQTQLLDLSFDPVDLSNGAFLKDDTDLMVGGSEPNGLRVERRYNSALRGGDPVGLGSGFTHNYNLRLTTRSPSDIDGASASVDAVLPFVIAARIGQDALANENSARSWQLATAAAAWAIDQQLNSRATISLGARSVEFVKRPNGSYVPPADFTATLTKLGDGSHNLSFRHGNTIHFRASDGKFDTIKDQFNNTLTATYDSSSRLDTVTDSYSRTFTFTYTGTRLTGVSDSTGRSVSYGLIGNNFTFTDAEGQMQTLEMNSDNLLTKVIDARNRTVVENDYDAWGRVYQQRTFGDTARLYLQQIVPGVGAEVDPAGNRVATYFDARGRKIFNVDQAGKLWQWRYDGLDRLINTISPQLNHRNWAYDPHHVLISETDEARNTRTIEPDLEHRPWKIRNFEGQETVQTYTAQHRLETITAPGGIVTSFTYDSRGRVLTEHPAAFASGAVLTYAYDANGHVDTVTYPGGGVDDHAYNARGDLTELIDRKGVKATFGYNNRRQPTSVTGWEGTTQRTGQTYYDAAGNVDYTLDASGRKMDLDHNALGKLIETKRGPSVAQVVTLTHSYSDARNLLTSSADALGNTVQYTYHATQLLATVKDPILRMTSFGYDEEKRRTTTTTPMGFVNTEIWDYRSFKDGVQDAENQLVDYTYDKDGRMTQLANRLNKSFGWAYNDASRIATSTTPTGKTTTETRNTRGLPETVEEPSGQTTDFTTYDNEGRLTQKIDDVGTTTYTYWPNGLPKQVTENGRTTYREYDALNRLSLYQDGEGNSISYQYLPSGELWKLTYPGNKTVTYDYDDFGRLWKVTDWSNRVTIYTYDNASRLTRIDRPNGTYRIQEYDAASQLRFIKEFKSGGTVITHQELRYDNDGRITYSFIHPKPTTLALPQDDLLYDDDNRLSSWNTTSVTFDNDGNMTNGPLPSGVFGTYVYDARNRLTSAGGSGYRYSPDGHRVEITGTGAATFIVDPNAALSRILRRTKGGVTTYYVYGLGLLYEETGVATKSYHADQVGSTLAMTDDGQNVTDRWSYAPYGDITYRLGSTDTPFQFNGAMGVYTDASGLYHMRARYYHRRLMRFCNADPIRFDGGFNWYAYAENSPAQKFDPSGEIVPLVAILGGAFVAALTSPHIANAPSPRDPTYTNLGPGALGPTLLTGAAFSSVTHLVVHGPTPIGGASTNIATSRVTDLASNASPIVTQRFQTVNVTLLSNGEKVLSANGRGLGAAQVSIRTAGEHVAPGAGVHAEIAGLQHASSLGLTPAAGAVSRPICAHCAGYIRSMGGELTSKTTYAFNNAFLIPEHSAAAGTASGAASGLMAGQPSVTGNPK